MIQQALPREFLDKCTPEEQRDVQSWWRGLNEHSQSDVCVLLDRRQDSCAYVDCDDEQGNRKWRVLPITGDELPFDDPQDDVREWQLEYFQHLLDHPELVIGTDVVVRTFHICVDHPAARKVLADGAVSSEFQCPVDRADCPIRSLFGDPKIRHCTLIAADHSTRRTTWFCV